MSGALAPMPGLARHTKFTEGPLHVAPGPLIAGDCLLLDAGGKPVAETFGGLDAAEAHANAQLFATASLLYATTRRLTFLLSSVPLLMQDTYARKQIQEAVRDAQAAIAAAERGVA